MKERQPGIGDLYSARVLLLACPTCTAGVGEKCHTARRRRRRIIGPHPERVGLAARVDKMGRP